MPLLPLAGIDPGLFAAFVAAVLGAGGLGSILAFRKADKEADEIAARTLIAVNEELRRELERRDEEIATLRGRVDAQDHLLRVKNDEIGMLRERVAIIENGHGAK